MDGVRDIGEGPGWFQIERRRHDIRRSIPLLAAVSFVGTRLDNL